MQTPTADSDRRGLAKTASSSLLRPSRGSPTAAAALPSPASPEYRQFLGGRLIDQYGDHYYLIVSIFNGVVLAVAALALIDIFSSHVSGHVKATGLALWLGAFGSLVSTYNGAMVHSIVITAPPNPLDMVIPFAFSLLECAAFALLIPVTSGPLSIPQSTATQLAHLQWWFLVEVAVTAVVVVYMANVQAQLTNTLRATPELAATVRWCKEQVRNAQMGIAVVMAALLVVWLVLLAGVPHAGFLRGLPSPARLRHWEGVAGLVFFLANVPALILQERGRRAILAGIADATAGSSPLPRLRERLSDQYARHYHLIVSVFKGLPLASIIH